MFHITINFLIRSPCTCFLDHICTSRWPSRPLYSAPTRPSGPPTTPGPLLPAIYGLQWWGVTLLHLRTFRRLLVADPWLEARPLTRAYCRALTYITSCRRTYTTPPLFAPIYTCRKNKTTTQRYTCTRNTLGSFPKFILVMWRYVDSMSLCRYRTTPSRGSMSSWAKRWEKHTEDMGRWMMWIRRSIGMWFSAVNGSGD